MKRTIVFVALVCLAVAGVASVGSAQGKTQKISKDLVKRAKDTLKEIEKVEKRLDETMKQQQKLLSKKNAKDRAKEQKKLQEALEKTQDAVGDLQKQSQDMEQQADKFFTEWGKGVAALKDEELKKLSQQNLDSKRSQYGQIVGTSRLAATQYGEFVQNMEASLEYLKLDLSDQAVAQLDPKMRETQSQASALKGSTRELTKKIEGYIAALN